MWAQNNKLMALEKVPIQYKSNEKWPKIASGKWNLRVQGSKLNKKNITGEI